jgi:hypothetical protein
LLLRAVVLVVLVLEQRAVAVLVGIVPLFLTSLQVVELPLKAFYL